MLRDMTIHRDAPESRPAVAEQERRETLSGGMHGGHKDPAFVTQMGNPMLVTVTLAGKLDAAREDFAHGLVSEAQLKKTINAVFKLQQQLDRARNVLTGTADTSTMEARAAIVQYKTARTGLIPIGKQAQDAIRARL